MTVSVEEKDDKAAAIGSLHLTRENTLNIAFKGIDSELVLKADLTKAKIDEDTRMSYISFSVKDANTSFIFELKPISQDNDSIDVSYIYIYLVCLSFICNYVHIIHIQLTIYIWGKRIVKVKYVEKKL